MALSLCANASTLGSQYHGSLNVPGTAEAQLRMGSKKSLGSGKSSNQPVHTIGTFFLVPTSVCNVLPLTILIVALIPMLASMGMIAWEMRGSSATLSL